MGKIYYIIGKSSSGKDTIFKELLARIPQLKRVVPYTTRPVREGEENGVEYFFNFITRPEPSSGPFGISAELEQPQRNIFFARSATALAGFVAALL